MLPNAPALIHPGRNRSALRQKRDLLLSKLHQKGIIDSLTYLMACREDLPEEPYPLPQNAPHLLAFVSKEKEVSGRIFSTINGHTQRIVNHILGEHHMRLSANHIYDAAVLVVDNRTNEVIAYAGNVIEKRMREKGKYVDVIRSPRSTGSILKPLLYASMIEKGELLPSQLVEDIPLRLGGFAPQNYSRTYIGAVPASRALARSLNIPAVHMLQQFGVNRFYFRLKQLGMSTLFRPADQYGLSLILGGAEGTLWDICGIYAGFAASIQSFFGYQPIKDEPIFLSEMGKKHAGNRRYRFNAGATWLTLSAMLEVSRPDLEHFWQNFASSRPIAWKTGTSFGHRDAWAIGITPEYTVGVWVGNADGEGRPDLTGLQAAAPILFDVFYQMPATSWFDIPESDLQEITVCSKSGYRPGPYCSKLDKTLIPYASEAGTTCPFCRLIHLDKTQTYRVNRSCYPDNQFETVSWFVLPPVVELYYINKHPDYRPLPFMITGCYDEDQSPFSLIYPASGGVLLVPVELNGEQGKTVLKAAHRRSDAILYWHIDNNYLGRTMNRHELAVSPSPGKHRLTLVDDRGNLLEQQVRIITADH